MNEYAWLTDYEYLVERFTGLSTKALKPTDVDTVLRCATRNRYGTINLLELSIFIKNARPDLTRHIDAVFA